jgi:site-specific recombinase XerD
MHSRAPVFLKLLENNGVPATSSSRVQRSVVSSVSIPLEDLRQWSDEYIDDCWARGQTERTIAGKREVCGKLFWFFENKGHPACDVAALRKFFVYLRNGHLEESGRWGNKHQRNPLSRRRVEYLYISLQTMFGWFIEQEMIEASPLSAIHKPERPVYNHTVFSESDLLNLFEAAAHSNFPERNLALLIFLFDTGLRVTELCNLNLGDLDLNGLRLEIEGKGRKKRTVHFSRETVRVLKNYLRKYPRGPQEALFISVSGRYGGQRLTRSGIGQIFKDLGQAAGLQGVRCSPHTMRHAFATQLCRDRCPAPVIQALLGHSTLKMTMVYTHLAQLDAANHHRQHSPVSQLVNRARK